MPDHATVGPSSTDEAALPPEPARRPGARERGRMRRRLRQQTRMREALLVDLGALVYELHRHSRREPELLQSKAAELTAVDAEVRGLTDALDAGHDMLALVSAGIAGSCERCGSLLSTDARYCSSCGAGAVTSLAGDAPAGGRDAGKGKLADSGSEPLEQQKRDLDPSTDEVAAVPHPGPDAEPAADPRPEAAAEPEPEPEAEAAPDPGSVTAAGPEPEADAGPDVRPAPEPKADVRPEPEPEADLRPEPEPEADLRPEPDAYAGPEPEPDVEPEPEQAEADPGPEALPEPEPGPEPAAGRPSSGGGGGKIRLRDAAVEPAHEPVERAERPAPEPDRSPTPAPTPTPPSPRRRRSGGLVGRASDALNRARKG